jgi:hypothetical protein
MSAILYTLADPRSPAEIRYVGWTSRAPKERLHVHLAEARRGGMNHRLCWLRGILSASLRPVMRTVAILESDAEAKRCEIAYIAALHARDCRLVNGTDGGEGMRGYVASAEARAKIRARKLGMTRPPFGDEWRARLSESGRNKVRSPEHRARNGAAHRGWIPTAETLANMSRAKKGKPVSAQCQAAALRANLGRKRGPMSEEQRAKLSLANMGKGHSQSKETRSAISLALRSYHERKRMAAFRPEGR